MRKFYRFAGVSAVVLGATLSGCAGVPTAPAGSSPRIAAELDAGATSRVTVIDRESLGQSQSLADALRLHPAVDITGR